MTTKKTTTNKKPAAKKFKHDEATRAKWREENKKRRANSSAGVVRAGDEVKVNGKPSGVFVAGPSVTGSMRTLTIDEAMTLPLSALLDSSVIGPGGGLRVVIDIRSIADVAKFCEIAAYVTMLSRRVKP